MSSCKTSSARAISTAPLLNYVLLPVSHTEANYQQQIGNSFRDKRAWYGSIYTLAMTDTASPASKQLDSLSGNGNWMNSSHADALELSAQK